MDLATITHQATRASGMLVEGRQTKNLLSALSDDESSAIDARALTRGISGHLPTPRAR